MLKTLDRYIDDHPKRTDTFASQWSRLGRDRRFTLLFAISVVTHLVFYAVLIRLDSWAIMQARQGVRQQVDLVKFVEIAPPPDHLPLRSAPEPLERADLKRLQFDPASADDIHLISRSPKPSEQRGSGGRLHSSDQIERQLRASRGNAPRQPQDSKTNQTSPPATSSIQANRLPNLEEARIAQTPPTQAAAVPPAPSSTRDASPPSAGTEAASAGTRRGSSSESTALGLEAAQAQYMALVRSKISKANERIMPRDWIKDVLRDKVSVDFELIIRRDGQILSTRLVHGSGYSVLDAYARQAIYTASPFEGFPQTAGNTIIFTVKVYFYTL
ncbi:MAG TPA: TonB C-terminal domain-containing protein [Blastocatellia bacterium]|nr:TonB C-terminal domain-containing protein [Blastocatellia bacterium]